MACMSHGMASAARSPDRYSIQRENSIMTRHDKPTKHDMQKFWSVFEAKQQRKREPLAQQQRDGRRIDQ
jgi:hypothetical protein